jgi:hypothetical protein
MTTRNNHDDQDAINRLPAVRTLQDRDDGRDQAIRLTMVAAVVLLVLTVLVPGLTTKGAFVLSFVPPRSNIILLLEAQVVAI